MENQGIVNPFLRGQRFAQASNESADRAQLQGLASLIQMQRSQQEAPLRQDLLRAQVADAQAKPEDRRNAQETTRQMGLARLQQAAGQFEQTMQMRLRSAQTAEERNAITQEYNQGRLALEGAARQQGAERLFYDTGIRTQVPQVGGGNSPQLAQPAPAPASGLESLLQGRPPMEQEAIRAAAGPTPVNLAVTPGGLVPGPGHGEAPAAPQAAPMPVAAPATRASTYGPEARHAPVQAPAGPLATPPVVAPQPVQAGAPATPAGPQMPQFVGSPREQATARNKWLAEASGGGPLVPVRQPDGTVTYVPRSQAAGQQVGSRVTDTNIGKQVKQLGDAFEKAGLPTMIAVTEAAGKLTPELAEYVTGPKSYVPDRMAGPAATSARQDVAKLFNITLKDRSGAAVTNQELERLKNEFSQGAFKTAEDLIGAIAKARGIVEAHYSGIAASYGPDVLEGYNKNLEAVGGKRFQPRGQNSGFSDPDKEKRYQEWKARNGG